MSFARCQGHPVQLADSHQHDQIIKSMAGMAQGVPSTEYVKALRPWLLFAVTAPSNRYAMSCPHPRLAWLTSTHLTQTYRQDRQTLCLNALVF